jgi:hypothetical protein
MSVLYGISGRIPTGKVHAETEQSVLASIRITSLERSYHKLVVCRRGHEK